MAPFYRVRESARTTPNFDRKASRAFWSAATRMTLIFGLPLAALLYYGQPGLRMQYWYHGDRASPIYTRYQYVTLFDGWRDIRPPLGIGMCPIIGFFPFELSDLMGSDQS